MKRSIVLGALLLSAATLVPMAAKADGWDHRGGRGDGWRGDGWRGHEGREHGWGGPRLVFRPGYAPPPVYYAPPPAYYAPPPVYYAPPPVYYRPQPTYVAPAYVAPYAAPSVSLGVNIPLR